MSPETYIRGVPLSQVEFGGVPPREAAETETDVPQTRTGVTFAFGVRLRNRLVRWKGLGEGYMEMSTSSTSRAYLKVSILDVSFGGRVVGLARRRDAWGVPLPSDKF